MAAKLTRPAANGKNRPAPKRRQLLRRFWLPAVLLLAIAAGGLTGIVLAYGLNYSRAAEEVKALATYRPSVVTRVYADDEKTVIGEFALERRIPLKHEEIPPVVKNAILAVEDVRFYEHMGIDPIRTVGAVWKNLTTDKTEGGSTLTQQLARGLFLTRKQTLDRKFNEWMVALQIERYYTKEQIMEMYVNNTFFGAGAYGVEAAANTYFGKQSKDLDHRRGGAHRRHPEGAEPALAHRQHGARQRPPRPRHPTDGQPRLHLATGGRRRTCEADQALRHGLLARAAALLDLQLPGRGDSPVPRRQVHDARRAERPHGLLDHQRRGADRSLPRGASRPARLRPRAAAGAARTRTSARARTGRPRP